MNPQELSKVIGIDPKAIRKFARTLWNSNGSWDFNEAQISVIQNHFKGAPVSVKAAPAVAAPVIHNHPAGWKTVGGLTQVAKQFLKENYGLELNIPININSRLSRALGRFRHYPRTGQPLDIEMGKHTIDHYGEEVTIDVLKHELVHYALFTLKRNFKDGQADFENELRRLGISRTHTYQKKGKVQEYICCGCGKVVAHRSKIIPSYKVGSYTSKCCGARIQYNGQKEI